MSESIGRGIAIGYRTSAFQEVLPFVEQQIDVMLWGIDADPAQRGWSSVRVSSASYERPTSWRRRADDALLPASHLHV